MPNRTDYLNDLAKHTGSLAVEVQARIEAPTVNAVETQFRKLREAGLVAIEDTSPRKYCLTEQGRVELAMLAETGGGQSAPSTQEAGLHSCVRELLSLERGISDMPRRELRKLRDSLRERINDEGVCENISRLVEAEIKLCEEGDGWWSDEDAVKRLETEIAQLKGALGLVEEATNEEK